MSERSSRPTVREAFGASRVSTQRRVIADTVADSEGAFTVEGLAAAARVRLPSLATATVYRAVAAMADAGFIERVGQAEDTALWARCDSGSHHHHAVCESCGALVCLECPLTEAVFESNAAGFRVTRHEYRLYGLCADCARVGMQAGESG